MNQPQKDELIGNLILGFFVFCLVFSAAVVAIAIALATYPPTTIP